MTATATATTGSRAAVTGNAPVLLRGNGIYTRSGAFICTVSEWVHNGGTVEQTARCEP